MAISITNRSFQPDYASAGKDWIIGNVFDKIDFSYTVNVEYAVVCTEQNGVQYKHELNQLILDQGNWIDYGFKVGDTVDFAVWVEEDNYTDFEACDALTISAISGNTMVVSGNIRLSQGNSSLPSLKP